MVPCPRILTTYFVPSNILGQTDADFQLHTFDHTDSIQSSYFLGLVCRLQEMLKMSRRVNHEETVLFFGFSMKVDGRFFGLAWHPFLD